MDEREQDDGSFMSMVLPEAAQAIVANDDAPPLLSALESGWRLRHIEDFSSAKLRDLLSSRVKNYRLSPTHLNSFIDMEYGGPQAFFFRQMLKFPQAPSVDVQFGNAVHETLEWVQHQTNELGKLPITDEILQQFDVRIGRKKLPAERLSLEIERGERALKNYFAQRGKIFKPGDEAEHNFRNEGVFVGDVHMAGNIDRMEIDRKNKSITIVDYKTGRAHAKWESSAKLHLYKRQLYCYKLLVENSHSYKGFKVPNARLEFIEADHAGNVYALELEYDSVELERTKNLIAAMWQHVQNLNFPDTSAYEPTVIGIKKFENDLLEGNI